MQRKSTSNPQHSMPKIQKDSQTETEDETFLSKKRKKPSELPYHINLFTKIASKNLNEKTQNIFQINETKTLLILSINKHNSKTIGDTITNLSHYNQKVISLRRDYLVDLKELDSKKRRILVDWLMEVCQLFNFQRETYHSAVVLLDIYLSKIHKVVIKEFQLIGITCLLIAAKNEEIVIPSIANFAQTTQFAYISKDILALEIKILNTLNWKINYPNLSLWMHFLMAKWDNYISNDSSLPKFQNKNESMYKEAFKVIDIISLDYVHLSKDMQIISSVVLYITIGLKLNLFTLKEVKELFSINENNIEYYQEFNAVFNDFLLKEINIELFDFREHLSYVSTFFCCINDREKQKNVHNNDNDNFNNDSSYNDNEDDFCNINHVYAIRIQDYSPLKSVVCQTIEDSRNKC